MRHLLLLLLPAMLMSQKHNAVVGGTTDETIPRLQVAGSDNGPVTTTPLVWRSNDGKAYTQGPSGHLIPYHAPVTINRPPRWTYAAYWAAVGADYFSTRYALSHGATDAMYRCNPHRAGCMNQATFWTVAAIPVGMWLLNDLWLHKRTSPQWQKVANFGRKLVIGGRFGVAAYNVGIANGIKGGRNGK